MRGSVPISFISLLAKASTQTIAVSRAQAALNTLQGWYNPTSGLWDTCGWWNGANCMTVLADMARVDQSDFVQDMALDIFNTTFHIAPEMSNPNPTIEQNSSLASSAGAKWVDGSFDDDGWWALAWIAAYDITKQQEYLDTAVGIYNLLSSTEQAPCGGPGGVYSDPNKNYVNAITNELLLSVAAHLANRAPNRDEFLNKAQTHWDWFRNSKMINERGTINDGQTETCENNGQTEWSYNQGVILGALVELDRASPVSNTDASNNYLESASRIAKAAIQTLADENNIIRESCDPDSCDANSTQFKGIFTRNLRHLHSVAPDEMYAKVIHASAKSVWENGRNAQNNQLGEVWAGPIGTQVDASTHSSAMDALVADISLLGIV